MKSIQKGYPFDGVKTREIFPNRLNPVIKDEKVHVTIDPEVYPAYFTTEMTDTDLKDFLLDRLLDYSEALKIAEQQISDMMEVYPFLPEDFGFTADELTEGENARKKYYFKGEYIMSRVDDTKWAITGKNMQLVVFSVENSHEAYIVLKSIGVITDDEFGEVVIDLPAETTPAPEG